MGLFSKKKPQLNLSTKETTGNYVAPTASPVSPVSPVSPAPVRPSSPLEIISATLGMADCPIPTEAKTVPTANEVSDDATFTPSGLLPKATSPTDDEPTGYDDARTYRTDYTNPTLKTTGSEDSKDSAFTITRNGQYLTLNGFANGHLMRWKFAAEEGPAFLRIPACLLALGVIGTTLYPVVSISTFWTAPIFVCCFHTCVLASLIVILEGRVFCGIRGPTTARARLRAVVTRYFNLFRLLWGRGLLYIFVGSMNLTIDHEYVMYTAFPLVILGVIAIGSGAHASYNLDKMKTSLTNVSYLWGKFDACDGDNDNSIDLNGFAELLWSLGLEFDDAYTYKAFLQLNGDPEANITFEQFRDWWIVTQNNGRAFKHTV